MGALSHILRSLPQSKTGMFYLSCKYYWDSSRSAQQSNFAVSIPNQILPQWTSFWLILIEDQQTPFSSSELRFHHGIFHQHTKAAINQLLAACNILTSKGSQQPNNTCLKNCTMLCCMHNITLKRKHLKLNHASRGITSNDPSPTVSLATSLFHHGFITLCRMHQLNL